MIYKETLYSRALIIMFVSVADHSSGEERDFNCCELQEDNMHPLCMHFNIPANDGMYGAGGHTCHDMKRSLAGHRPNCALG